MTYDYRKLRKLIKQHYSNMSVLAKKMGISRQQLSYKLNNHSAFSQTQISKIAKILDIPDSLYHEYFFTEDVRKVRTKEEVHDE